MTPLLVKLALGAGALAVSALMALMETAFLSLSRLQLARLQRARPGRLAFWVEDPDRALAVILLVNNLLNVGIGFLATAFAADAQALWGVPLHWGHLVFPGAAVVAVRDHAGKGRDEEDRRLVHQGHSQRVGVPAEPACLQRSGADLRGA